MTYPIFPKSAALGFVSETPDFASELIQMNGGGVRSIVRRSRPLRRLSFGYNNGLVANFRAIVEKIEECRGSGYPALIRDWRHYSVEDQIFGIGDGTTTGIQLLIAFGGSRPYDFPVKFLDEDDGDIVVKSNGVVKAIASKVDGLVVPTTPWAAGETLTWTGRYYVACRIENSAQSVTIDGPNGAYATLQTMSAIEDINA
ncbi:MAG: hypothetical protein EOS58_30765 [Mesorhizobium sp.]|nr:MAG: hypothetical protein EOS58_30765 [Mesorhizobium sp.]